MTHRRADSQQPDRGPLSDTGGGPAVLSGGGHRSGAAEPVRLRLDIAYDGTDFRGWAVQPGLRTVAGELGQALQVLFRGPVPLVVAGRTDSGVHASGQVAHIDVDPRLLAALAPRQRRGARPGRSPQHSSQDGCSAPDGSAAAPDAARPGLTGLRRRLAGLLPADLRVSAVTAAPPGFDARFSALRRHYRYRIATADWGVDPLRRTDVLHLPRELDVHRMQRAAQALLGLHDFAAYCRPREGSTTIRDLQRLDVRAAGTPGEVEVLVSADAFCHSMVRSLVGVLIGVGEGRSELTVPAELLAAGERTAAVHTAPARGLTLTGVDYPPVGQLAERAAVTRAVRDDGAGRPERASKGERAAADPSAARGPEQPGERHT